jgi:hypothetical protein
MPNPSAAERTDPAEAAMARVLRAEREAHASIEGARVAAAQCAEAARADARTLAARTERRIRAVVGAFERDLAARLAAIDAEAAAVARPHALNADEQQALSRAVQALARTLTGAAS